MWLNIPAMDLDLVYGALAHQARRRLVEQIAPSPARVTELAAAFPVSLAATSKHIRVLEHAGLVHREVRGRDHFLSLEPAPLAEATAWLAGYRRFWEQRLDLLEARILESRGRD
jgi:DNA-binding transcriptional ArsR family regulator